MRILATFSAAFSFGIFLAQYFFRCDQLLPLAVISLLASWASSLISNRQTRRKCLLIGTGLTLAFGWNWLYMRQVQQPLETLAGSEHLAEFVICEEPIQTSYGAKASVKLKGFSHGELVYYGDFSLLDCAPGQTVRDQVRFESSIHMEDGDISSFASRGIYLLAYHDQHYTPVYETGSSDSIRWLPLHTAKKMQHTIQTLYDGEPAAFLTAILTGNRQFLSEEVSADLSEAGLSHVLAVSGMHCGFLLALLTLVIGKQHQRTLALFAIPTLLFYAALTGCSPSVLRACTMLLLFLLAPLTGRESDGWTSLFFALFLILLQNPFAIASVSLQLSFGALAGILFVTPKLLLLLSGVKKHGKVFHFIVAGISTTIGAMVCTVPLCAVYFNTLSLVSPVSNLLCLSAASVVFMTGLISVGLGIIFPPAATLSAVLPTLLIRWILSVAHVLASVPYHAVFFNNPYLKYWLCLVYLLFGIVYVSKSKSGRSYLLAAGLSAFSLAATLSIGTPDYDSDLDAFVLDIGQGQCILLTSDQHYAVLDCGSAQKWTAPGKTAADQLRTMGCKKLDYLLLTHYDTDHISGVAGLMARLPVDTLVVPPSEDDAGLRVEILETVAAYPKTTILEVTSPEKLDFGKADITVYPPLGTGKDNECGLTYLTTVAEQDLLVTGDMSSASEKRLIDAYSLPDIEVLIAGHHGSKSSSCREFLDTVTPEIVCISAGKHNRYGHPSEDVLQRLARRYCTIYRTDLHGDIHIMFNQGDHNGIQEKGSLLQ